MLKSTATKIIHVVPIIVLVVAFPFFFFGGAIEESSKLLSALWDCGHLVFFIALVLALSQKCDLNNWRIGALITATVFFGGGLIEIIQANIGRDGNWDDLLRDLTGTWLGLFWLQRPQKWVWVGRIASVILLIPNLSAVFFETWYQLHAREKFPLLAGFESSIELRDRRTGTERSTEYHTQGNYSLKVQLAKKPYSGIKFVRLMGDWRGFKQLSIDIYNPDSQTFDMSIRINDIDHKRYHWTFADRFNRSFLLASGWNHFTFALHDIQYAPANRLMDLSKISAVEIFAVTPSEKNRVIYLDNIRLE